MYNFTFLTVYLYTMTKDNRHKAIKEILREEDIANQDSLLNVLIDRGFELTQATLSRDMKELKVIKAPSRSGQYIYQLPDDNMQPSDSADIAGLSAAGFVSIEFSGQLAVIKTRPGYAMAIASEIDHKAVSHIIGTVAGDDTILVIPRESKTREEVVRFLSTFIPNLK